MGGHFTRIICSKQVLKVSDLFQLFIYDHNPLAITDMADSFVKFDEHGDVLLDTQSIITTKTKHGYGYNYKVNKNIKHYLPCSSNILFKSFCL